MADFRIDVGFFGHTKTKKLRRRLGLEGVFALQMLWAYAAMQEHGHGKVYSSEDIELAVDWTGEPDSLVSVLADVGFLDVVDGGYTIHEWEVHNGYAAAASRRSEAARNAANKKWALRRNAEGNAAAQENACDGNASACQNGCGGNAPSPSPSPSPDPVPSHEDARAHVDRFDEISGQAAAKPTASTPPEGDNVVITYPTAGCHGGNHGSPPLPPGQALPEYSIEFLQIVELFPRKEGIEDAWIVFKGLKAAHQYPGNPIVLPVLSEWVKSDRWTDEGGRYVPSLKKWLQGKRWQDEAPKPRAPSSPALSQNAESMAKSTAAVISKLSQAKRSATPMPEHMRGRFAQGGGGG